MKALCLRYFSFYPESSMSSYTLKSSKEGKKEASVFRQCNPQRGKLTYYKISFQILCTQWGWNNKLGYDVHSQFSFQRWACSLANRRELCKYTNLTSSKERHWYTLKCSCINATVSCTFELTRFLQYSINEHLNQYPCGEHTVLTAVS